MGKGGKGYILKNWLIHRGVGAPQVNRDFKDVIRLTGTPKEYLLKKNKRIRMQIGGPRFAAMGRTKI